MQLESTPQAHGSGGGGGSPVGRMGRRVRGFMRSAVGGRARIGADPRRLGFAGSFLSPLRTEQLFERELLTELSEAK